MLNRPLIWKLRSWYHMTRFLDPLTCEHCEKAMLPRWPTLGRTMYPYEGPTNASDDPNRSQFLCAPCEKDHDEYWDAMWSEYYSSQGY